MPRAEILYRAFTLALVIVLGLASAACQDEVIPDLVKVTDLVPREVEVGDRIEITGTGFPQGRSAKITFNGELRRPGERPRQVVIYSEGLVTSPQSIELTMSDTLEAAFCDRGDQASHTTFIGSVQVAFAGALKGYPPVAGTLPEVSLDLQPASVRAFRTSELAREGKALAAHLGLELEPQLGRLAITKVVPGSVGELSGLRAGDSILSLDGVRTRELADFSTAEDRAAQVRLLRGEPPREHVREVPLDGLRGKVPRDVATALAIVFASVACVFLLFAPLPWGESTDERVGERLRKPLGDLRGALRSIGEMARTPSAIARLGTLAATSTALVAVASAGVVIQGDVLGLVALQAGTLTLALVVGSGLRRPAAVVGREVAKTAAILVAAHAAGSISTLEIARGQGNAPWEWTAFASPGLFGLAAFVCIMHVHSRAALSRLEGSVARASAAAHDALTCVSVCTVLGGGWPSGSAAPAQAVSFVLKVLVMSAVVAIVAASKEADPELAAPGSWPRRFFRSTVALGLPLIALTALHAAWLVLPIGSSPRLWTARVLTAVCAALAVRFIVRVAQVAERRAVRADPYA